MVDGFKKSLDHLNSLRWAIVSISVSILFLKSTGTDLAFLGLPIPRERSLFIIPIVLVFLLLARQVIIINMIEIVKEAEDKGSFREVVLSYPMAEFMRWRIKSRVGALLLTFHQMFMDLIPAAAASALWANLPKGQEGPPLLYKILTFVLVGLAVWNWSSLRFDLYRPLAGDPAISE